MFYKLRKVRAEAEIARRKADQDKLALETRANAQIIQIYANTMKQKEGTQNIEFYEEELRHALGAEKGMRLHATMELLKQEGKAKKSEVPGYWIID